MNPASNDFDQAAGKRAGYALTSAQVAFAQLLGDALARQWAAEGKQAADSASTSGPAGQQIHRSREP